jgi:hypothetical protein
VVPANSSMPHCSTSTVVLTAGRPPSGGLMLFRSAIAESSQRYRGAPSRPADAATCALCRTAGPDRPSSTSRAPG